MILFGFKGCGKTYFGQLLAKETGLIFIDTDHLIEKFYENLTCRQIAQKFGEEAFRELERKAIGSIEKAQNAIISVGGGAVLDAQNCQRLGSLRQFVYLEVEKETIKKRMFDVAIPSYLDPSDPEGSFEKMYNERKPIYEGLYNVKIDVSGKTDFQILYELKKIVTSNRVMNR